MKNLKLKIILTILVTIIIIIVFKFTNGFLYENYKSDDFDPKVIKTKVSSELSEIPVYVINMKSRKDRKAHMINLLDTLGFKNYTFVVPVPKEEAMKDPIMENTNLTPSKASNTLTFFKIFKETPYDKFIIMEDDIDIYFDDATMTDVYNSAKSHPWDLLYFEFCFADCDNLITVSPSLYKLPRAVCTGCTMFKKSAGLKLIENFDNKTMAKDQYFSDMNLQGIVNSYGFPLFRQNPKFGSDLEGSFKYTNSDVFSSICSSS